MKQEVLNSLFSYRNYLFDELKKTNEAIESFGGTLELLKAVETTTPKKIEQTYSVVEQNKENIKISEDYPLAENLKNKIQFIVKKLGECSVNDIFEYIMLNDLFLSKQLKSTVRNNISGTTSLMKSSGELILARQEKIGSHLSSIFILGNKKSKPGKPRGQKRQKKEKEKEVKPIKKLEKQYNKVEVSNDHSGLLDKVNELYGNQREIVPVLTNKQLIKPLIVERDSNGVSVEESIKDKYFKYFSDWKELIIDSLEELGKYSTDEQIARVAMKHRHFTPLFLPDGPAGAFIFFRDEVRRQIEFFLKKDIASRPHVHGGSKCLYGLKEWGNSRDEVFKPFK